MDKLKTRLAALLLRLVTRLTPDWKSKLAVEAWDKYPAQLHREWVYNLTDDEYLYLTLDRMNHNRVQRLIREWGYRVDRMIMFGDGVTTHINRIIPGEPSPYIDPTSGL